MKEGIDLLLLKVWNLLNQHQYVDCYNCDKSHCPSCGRGPYSQKHWRGCEWNSVLKKLEKLLDSKLKGEEQDARI